MNLRQFAAASRRRASLLLRQDRSLTRAEAERKAAREVARSVRRAARQEASLQSKLKPFVPNRLTVGSEITEANVGEKLMERMMRFIHSLDAKTVIPSWSSTTRTEEQRVGAKGGARATPDERSPRTPAAASAPTSNGGVLGVFAGNSPTGATRISDDEFPRSMSCSPLANWKASGGKLQ
jgi:hypothetical protein